MNWKDKCDVSVLLWSRTPKGARAPLGEQSRKMEPGVEHHLWSSGQGLLMAVQCTGTGDNWHSAPGRATQSLVPLPGCSIHAAEAPQQGRLWDGRAGRGDPPGFTLSPPGPHPATLGHCRWSRSSRVLPPSFPTVMGELEMPGKAFLISESQII